MKTENHTEQNLDVSRTFCILPWIHTHIWANGNVFPCCMSDYRFPVTNYHSHQTISEIINHPSYQEIRTNMLAGNNCKECTKCYELELNSAHSMRIDSNHRYLAEVKRVLSLADNDKVNIKDFKLKFLDIRFSNLCNLNCVMCSPIFSNKLYKIHKSMGEHVPDKELLNLDIYENLKPYLLNVTNVNFAGGEPFINLEHYKILQYWIENNHLQVNINYTSNMTTLNYKDYDLIELWKKFSNISILASIDDFGQDISKIRKGANWSAIATHIQRIQSLAPHVKIKISPTIGALNLHRLFTMVKEMYSHFQIPPADWQVNILQYPEFFSIKGLETCDKEQFLIQYDDFKEWLSMNNLNDNNNFQSIINFVKENMTFDQDLMIKKNEYLNKFNQFTP